MNNSSLVPASRPGATTAAAPLLSLRVRVPRQQRAAAVVLTTAPVRCCRSGARRSDSNGPRVRLWWSELVGLGHRLCRAGRAGDYRG